MRKYKKKTFNQNKSKNKNKISIATGYANDKVGKTQCETTLIY